jgi:hypothetical protein
MRGFLFVATSLIAIASAAAPHAIAAEAHQSLAGEVGAVWMRSNSVNSASRTSRTPIHCS